MELFACSVDQHSTPCGPNQRLFHLRVFWTITFKKDSDRSFQNCSFWDGRVGIPGQLNFKSTFDTFGQSGFQIQWMEQISWYSYNDSRPRLKNYRLSVRGNFKAVSAEKTWEWISSHVKTASTLWHFYSIKTLLSLEKKEVFHSNNLTQEKLFNLRP